MAASAPGRIAGETSDAELLARTGVGDADAFATLYDRYAGRTLGIAQRVLASRADAEEVVQEVFVQLWKAPERYDPRRGKLGTWLFVLARNRAVDRLRQRGGQPPGHPLQTHDDAPAADAETLVAEGQRRSAVLRALRKLPDPQRRAIELAYYGGLSQSEIAAAIHEPVGTVKSRMSRAMAFLREALEGSV
jgi:RNA polymerase sigma-70 factor (ECF subfamily)